MLTSYLHSNFLLIHIFFVRVETSATNRKIDIAWQIKSFYYKTHLCLAMYAVEFTFHIFNCIFITFTKFLRCMYLSLFDVRSSNLGLFLILTTITCCHRNVSSTFKLSFIINLRVPGFIFVINTVSGEYRMLLRLFPQVINHNGKLRKALQ